MKRAAALITLLAAVALLAWQRPAPPQPVSAAGATRTDVAVAVTVAAPSVRTVATTAPHRLASDLPPAPPSLAGSEPDGGATLDRAGRLHPDSALRRYFDWHRAGVGELDESEIRLRLQAGLAARLPAGALAEALALYDRYLDYLAASDRLPFEADPLRQLDQLRRLRRALLGDAIAAAFFESEELALEARLLRRQIADDRGLDDAERQDRLAALDAALPVELRVPVEQQAVVEAEQLSDEYEASGVPPEQRRQERAALYGDAAAQRLAALDAARLDWQRRLDQFNAQRARLQGDPRLAEAERAERLRRWMAEHFDPIEQRRLQALLDDGLLDPGAIDSPGG